MADLYIDFFEVGEYGQHFLTLGRSLVGASPLVDVNVLLERVGEAMGRVGVELERAGIQRSTVRTGSGRVAEASQTGRVTLEKFWSFLGSLDEDPPIDGRAFFPEGKQGTLTNLKPADLHGKIEQVLRGFSVPGHAMMPQADKWQGRLREAAAGLAGVLGSQGEVRGTSLQATAELQQARERFVLVYNGVAKPLVRGLLTALGRKDDYVTFFKDLQVNEEGGSAVRATPAAPMPA